MIRDELGRWCAGFYHNAGYCDATWAEMRALLRGLQIAVERNYSPLIVELDSQVSIRYLAEGVKEGNPIALLVSKCKDLVRLHGHVEVLFCPRVSNKLADWLASYALVSPVCCNVLDYPPDGCLPYLEGDQLNDYAM